MNADTRRHRERGSLAMFMVLFTPAVLLLAGLVVDGGMAINARERAADIAGQAARYVANDVNLGNLRSGGAVTINGGACARVTEVFARYDAVVTGSSCAVGPDGQSAHVEVTIQWEAQLLGLIPSLDTFEVTARADADAVSGI